MTFLDITFPLIAFGVTIQAAQCLVMSFQDVIHFKDYKR